MSNLFSQQDAFCIVNKDGYFVFVNQLFLTLFSVSEQECYNGLSLNDFVVSPQFLTIFNTSYKELVFKSLHGKYFAAFLSSEEIPETNLYAISVRVLSRNVSMKRIVTSFRRYIDNQVAIICFKLDLDHHFLPLININTDIIDDNPSFVINIGNELTNSLKNNIRDFKNFSGLTQSQKLEKYQNYFSLPYVFQLLVLDSKNESDISTETFLIAFIFPGPLFELFKDELKLKKVIKEHLSQLHSPSELSIKFLEEMKLKVALYFDSQSIIPPTQVDNQIHNLEIYSRLLTNMNYIDALKSFSEFTVNNFAFNSITIYHVNEYEIIEQVSFVKGVFYKPESIDYEIEHPFHNTTGKVIGYFKIKTTDPNFEKDIKIKSSISNKLAFLYETLFHANFEFLEEFAVTLLLENTISDIFEATKHFVTKIFQTDVKVFAALIYESKTETLNFISQFGYAPTFDLKSIALNSNNSICAKTAREKKLLNIPDVSKCNFYLEGESSIKSELCIPLVYKDQLIGVLNIESQKLDVFKPDYHVPLFKLIGEIVLTNYVRISAVKKVSKLNFA